MKRITRLISVLAALFIVFSMSVDAQASVRIRTYTQQVGFTGTMNEPSHYARLYTAFPTTLKKNLTPNVADVKILNKSIKGRPKYIITFRFKKKLPAHIRVSEKINGTKHTTDIVMKPKAYTSPVSSIKINGRQYFKGNAWIHESGEALSGKISITTKKNWRVTDLYKFKDRDWNHDPTLKPFKNGGKISVKKGERLVIKYRNTKTGDAFLMFYDCGFTHTPKKS